MRTNVLVIAGLAVLSTSAFASKARMEALGQGNTSYYLNDTRSVFLNPASLNETKNYIVTEWGKGSVGDSKSAPRAEGGFFREMGAFSYGLYLGNNPDDARKTNTTGTTVATDFLDHQNSLDLVLAGDMGVKWGARVHFANSKDETTTGVNKKNSAFGLGLGVMHGDMEGYANVTLSDKSEGATVTGDLWKRKPSFQVGGSYKWSGMTFFADYTNSSEEFLKGTSSTLVKVGYGTDTSDFITLGTGTATRKTSEITVGAAKVHELNPTARLVTDARLVFGDEKIGGASTGNGKATETTLPLTFAVEADATSWLTLRGSISQNFILGEDKDVNGKKASVANSTTVNGGATLNFGKLKVDGLIGTTKADGTENTKAGVLSTSNLLTRVGVTYNF